MINQQSAANSTSQVRSNTNAFVSYVPTQPLELDRQTTTAGQGPQQQQSTPSTHRLYIHPKSLLERKKHQTMPYRDERIPPLICSVDTVYFLPPSRDAA